MTVTGFHFSDVPINTYISITVTVYIFRLGYQIEITVTVTVFIPQELQLIRLRRGCFFFYLILVCEQQIFICTNIFFALLVVPITASGLQVSHHLAHGIKCVGDVGKADP